MSHRGNFNKTHLSKLNATFLSLSAHLHFRALGEAIDVDSEAHCCVGGGAGFSGECGPPSDTLGLACAHFLQNRERDNGTQ